MPQVSTEHVLVVPTHEFHRLGHFQGFSRDVDRYLAGLMRPELMSYRPRSEMEEEPAFKQLIPYCIFRCRDDQGRETIFQYTRGTGQGEGRLHRKRSIGVGGHISSDDAAAAGENVYQEGLRRELAEEIQVDAVARERCVGMINDDESAVGRVHLGVVHVYDLESPSVRPREAEMVDCGFEPVDSLLADLAGFETWSQICLQALFGPQR